MADPHPTSIPHSSTSATATGLTPNVGGALAYLLGPITGILFLVIEKENRFIRFHAAQSVGITVAWFVFWIGLTILSTVLGAIPVIGWITAIFFLLISIPLGLAGFVLWLALMYRAYQGSEWQLPLVGPHAMRFVEQGAITR